MSKTAQAVQVEVNAILEEFGLVGSGHSVYVSEIRRRPNGIRYGGVPTGAFSIDIAGFRSNFAPRQHLFRTNQDGVVPAEKIRAVAATVKGRVDLLNAVKSIEDKNKSAATEVLEHAGYVMPDSYFSNYVSNSGKFIAPSGSERAPVRLNMGTMGLTVDQAKAVLDLIATFNFK